MIIPLINCARLSDRPGTGFGEGDRVPDRCTESEEILSAGSERLATLVDSIRHWGLFGKVALSGIRSSSLSELEKLLPRVGGQVDVVIASEGKNETELLRLLNAGAVAIFGEPGTLKISASIPDECWFTLADPDSDFKRGDQLILDQPRPDQVAELDQQGVAVLIDVAFLEQHPAWCADFFNSTLTSDRPDQLWPTVIVDELGLALGLAYSNYDSLRDAIEFRRGTYWSRSRNELWVKGASSGNTQRLLGIRLDCDRDALRFQVQQAGAGFCHLGTHACFGQERTIATVIQRLRERCQSSDEGSFTKQLINRPAMLQAKLLEEAQELAEAKSQSEVAFEAADVLYFTLVKMLSAEVGLESVYEELARRMTRVVRRKNKLEES